MDANTLLTHQRGPSRGLARVEENEFGCWVWLGALTPTGYGKVGGGGARGSRLAHRVSYEAFVGPIPEGLVVDHLCGNRACINPWHLEPVTQEVNVERGEAGLNNRVKTHCPNGHEYDGARPDGRRYCKRCA